MRSRLAAAPPPSERGAPLLGALTELGERQLEVFRKSLERPLPGRKRLRLALQLVDEFVAVIAAETACCRGCAHCCHIPVELSELEARELGVAIGRVPNSQGRYVPEDPSAFGYGTPCPFLDAQQACSIYEHCPFACRQHHSLDADELFCRLDVPAEFAASVPSVRPNAALAAWGSTLRPDTRVVDIRDWFPSAADRARGPLGPLRTAAEKVRLEAAGKAVGKRQLVDRD